MYSELIGNYKKYRIKSLYDNKLTIMSPSNMIRQFQTNLSNLGTSIGQLFIPLLSKVLPYINGVTIALQRLFVWIGNLMGIKIDLDKFGEGYSEMGDDIDGVADSLDDATKAGKKFKSQLAGFDELNNLTSSANAGAAGAGMSGMIDLTDEIIAATKEYEKVWNEAFENMENEAVKIAEKVERAFDDMKAIFIDFKFGNFDEAARDISRLIVDFNTIIANSIDNVNWSKIGQKIGDFIKNIKWLDILLSVTDVVRSAANAAMETWFGSLEEAPIETSLATLIGLAISGVFGKPFSVKSIALKILAVDFALEAGFSLGKLISKYILPEEALENLEFFGGKGFWDTIKYVFTITPEEWAELGDDFKTGLDVAWNKVEEWWQNTDLMKDITKFTDTWKLGWNMIYESSKETWGKIVSFFTSALPEWWSNNISPWFTKEKWAKMLNNIKIALQDKWNATTDWWNNTAIVRWWNQITTWFNLSKWKGVFSNIKTSFVDIWNGAIETVKGLWNSFAGWLNQKLTFTIPKVDIGGFSFGGDTIKLVNIPQFATGGFPEDGLFFANHSELVGQFSNGKTAVANNSDIQSGIKQGVREAILEVLAPYLAAIAENTRETANKNFTIGDKDVHSAFMRENRRQTQITHRNPVLA